MALAELDVCIDRLESVVDEARRVVLGLEVGCADVDQLRRITAAAGRLRNMTDAVSADVAARAAELRRGGCSKPVDDAVNPGGRTTPGEEKTARDRAGVLGLIPGLDDATRSGELPGRYADVVARAVKGLDAEVRAEFYRRHQGLADVARKMSVQAFGEHIEALVARVLHDCGVDRAERQRRQRRVSTFRDLDGMFCLSGKFDPHTGARISSAISAEVNAIYRACRDDDADRRCRDQIVADAVTNLLVGTSMSVNQRRGSGGTTLLVMTDEKTARGGLHDASVHEYGDGSTIEPATLESVVAADDTTILTAVVNEHGVVTGVGDERLDWGRDRRLASEAQRLALRAMHRSCIVPGCDAVFDACEIHHLIEWERGGRTDLHLLGPLCVRHHHIVHAEGWKLRFDPTTRALTIRYPDGTIDTIPHRGLSPPGPAPPAA